MRVNNKWFYGEESDSWQFHMKNKGLIVEFLKDPKPSKLKLLEALTIKPEWLHETEGDVDPPNMDYFNRMEEAYFKEIDEGRIKPPLTEKLILRKVWAKGKALYRLDSAYLERIGGILTFILVQQTHWKGKTKKERVEFLKTVKLWWDQRDMRERYKDYFRNFFDYMIEGYEKKEFYYKSLDFLIDWHIENGSVKDGEDKAGWLVPNDPNGMNIFDPANWYPRGKGQVNYLLHHSKS